MQYFGIIMAKKINVYLKFKYNWMPSLFFFMVLSPFLLFLLLQYTISVMLYSIQKFSQPYDSPRHVQAIYFPHWITVCQQNILQKPNYISHDNTIVSTDKIFSQSYLICPHDNPKRQLGQRLYISMWETDTLKFSDLPKATHLDHGKVSL